MKVLNFGDITITPGDKQGLQNVIKEITKGETNMAVGRAWLLWFACTLRDKTDDQIKNSVFRGMGEKKIFIQWLIGILSDPETAPEKIYQLTIATGGTYCQAIPNEGDTITWQDFEAVEEIECYQFSGLDLKGFGSGTI